MASITNEYFTIQAKDEYQPYLEMILKMITEKAEIVRKFFDVSEYRPVKVTIFEDISDLKDEALKTKKVYDDHCEASFSKKGIGVFDSEKDVENSLDKIVNKIVHQYSHIIYSTIYTDIFDRPLWLDEGIAQILSGERYDLQLSEAKSKKDFLRHILNRHKEIPKIEYLCKDGNTSKTIGSPKYSGHLMSYFMVNYLLSSQVVDNEFTKDEIALIDNKFNTYESDLAIAKAKKNNLPVKPRYNFSLIMNDPEYRKKIEDSLVSKTINYFGSSLKVKMSAASIKYIREPKDFIDYLDANIVYGWFDEDKNVHKDDSKMMKLYRTGSTELVNKHFVGTSIELSKLELEVLQSLGYSGTIHIHKKEDKENNVSFQAFVIVEKDDRYYYLRNNRLGLDGVFEFGSYKAFLRYYLPNIKDNSTLYEVDDIPSGLSLEELNDYLERQEIVDFESVQAIIKKV